MFFYPSQNSPFLHGPPTTFNSFSSNNAEEMKLESETTAVGDELGDESFVDELLDFSNGFSEEVDKPEEMEQEKMAFTDFVSPDTKPVVIFEALAGEKDAFAPLLDTQIALPVEELENLEWLSHFVEDSLSNFPLTEKLPPKPVEPAAQHPCFTAPVQTKTGTKHAQTGVRVWPVMPPQPSMVMSPQPSTSSSSSTSSVPITSPIWNATKPLPGKPVVKTRKKAETGGKVSQHRRCTHCGVTKTPQWRTGPLGVKTLCNACGVRFKSGRLYPEYRPASSPTFSTELHSNNHRKVLEMRKKKEIGVDAATGLDYYYC